MLWQGGLLLMCCLYCHADLDPLSNTFVHKANNFKTSWKAGKNLAARKSMKSVHKLMGVLPNANVYLLSLRAETNLNGFIASSLPENFDARKKWVNCLSLLKIKDQGVCSSCWAVAATQVMSDRICISSGGYINPEISSGNLLSCCKRCGKGCDGGYPGAAWKYWIQDGLVSGGDYGSEQGCLPYPYEPCQYHVNGSSPSCDTDVQTISCSKTCNPGSNLNYKMDLHFGADSYKIKNDENAIKAEIYKNGPVQVTFNVYEDFLHYKTGVYQHITGLYLGDHSVKILGWGVQNGVPYWLAANSWNTNWGDMGFFKILRGSNHCSIESYAVAGLPKI